MPKAIGQRISPDAAAQQLVQQLALQITQRYPGANALYLAGRVVRVSASDTK